MLYFEKRIFLQLLDIFDNYNSNCINALLFNKKPIFDVSCEIEGEQSLKTSEDFLNKEKDKKLIKILNDVPSFVWEDNNKFGPFKPEERVFLPEKVSELLIRQKMAQEVK
jgi:hypothetical protein